MQRKLEMDKIEWQAKYDSRRPLLLWVICVECAKNPTNRRLTFTTMKGVI